MLSKRLIISLYSVLFVVIILISAVFAFTVNKIDTEFAFLQDAEKKTESLNDKLSSFFGKNLIFLDTKEVVFALSEDPTIECVSVEKSYPNALKVAIKERRAIYLISYEGNQYVADENGFVFKEYTGEKQRDLIRLSFKDIDMGKPVIGTYLSTNNENYDKSLKSAFEIAKSVDLTDKIDEMRIVKNYGDTSLTSFDVEFFTYTEVVIKIKKSDDDGINKAKAAFSAYDAADDYKKSFYSIETYKEDNGQIQMVWTRFGD